MLPNFWNSVKELNFWINVLAHTHTHTLKQQQVYACTPALPSLCLDIFAHACQLNFPCRFTAVIIESPFLPNQSLHSPLFPALPHFCSIYTPIYCSVHAETIKLALMQTGSGTIQSYVCLPADECVNCFSTIHCCCWTKFNGVRMCVGKYVTGVFCMCACVYHVFFFSSVSTSKAQPRSL